MKIHILDLKWKKNKHNEWGRERGGREG
jgi:hypothetical protein